MKDTALKMKPVEKINLSVITTSAQKPWTKKVYKKIEKIFHRSMLRSEDLETWRRLEFRNDFRDDQDDQRLSWRL